MEQQQEVVTLYDEVILYNGMPKIKVTKMRAGFYQWATIKHGMFDHTLLEEVEKFMKRHGWKFYIVEQTKEQAIRDAEDINSKITY